MYRVVLDTVVFVRALIPLATTGDYRNPRSVSGRLLSDEAERFTLLVSKPTAQELLEVIQRPELTRKYRSLGRISVQQVIDLLARAELVDIGAPSPVVRDPKDDIFVATAIAGQANFIVSEDKDLLDLQDVSGIPIVDTRAFIERLSTKR